MRKSRTNKKFNQKIEIENFQKSIFELIDQVCSICERKFYKEGVKKFNINEKINLILNKVGYKFVIDSKIITCHACHSTLSANKLPAMSFLNHLDPGTIPTELAKLNLIEISCISRVKPYMKIMKMNNVFGQASFKGNVVHFAQAIEEVYEQLPLRLIDSDNIIVTERRENILNVKQFTVRPKLLFEALVWLKNNNHLYNNVEIVDRVEQDFNINYIIVEKNINLNEHEKIRVVIKCMANILVCSPNLIKF